MGTGFYTMDIIRDLKEISDQGLVKKGQVESHRVEKWEQSGHLFQEMWLKREAMNWDARKSHCEGIVGMLCR